MRVFVGYLEQIVGKSLFGCFIYMFILIFCIDVTFDGLCCWLQLCGLLSLLPLKVANQSWHTGPNETVLHFQVVFVVCWHQIRKLVLVIFWTVSLILHKIRKNLVKSSLCEYIETNIPVERLTLHVFCMIFSPDCRQKFVWMLHLYVCLDLLHFVSLSTIYGVERKRCGLLSRIHLKVIDQSWHTGPNEFVLQLEVVFVVC